jgi:hypothetical protein
MIRKLKSGEYRLYSRKKNPKSGKRRNLPFLSLRSKPLVFFVLVDRNMLLKSGLGACPASPSFRRFARKGQIA